ncbi:MAG: hypothetical protein MR227_00055 [Firmicutes bacterium]|nr:hypothetical protein [Bacillota bacterium]
MLKINNNEYNVLMSSIKYVEAIYNSQKVYSALVLLDIQLNGNKGFISFYIDFFDENDIKNIENKKYRELPTELNSKISMIEIYDTKNFIDFIDSEINLEFGNIVNNQIEMKLDIDDELIKLEYKGLLGIK